MLRPRTSAKQKQGHESNVADVEAWIWLSLPAANILALLFRHTSQSLERQLYLVPSSCWCLFQCVICKMRSSESSSANGNLMAMALVPSLAHSIAIIHVWNSSMDETRRWISYTLWATLSSGPWMWLEEPVPRRRQGFLFFYFLLTALAFVVYPLLDTGTVLLTTWESLQWIILHTVASRQYAFFVNPLSSRGQTSNSSTAIPMSTWGEYQTLAFLVVIGILEYQVTLLQPGRFNLDDNGNDGISIYYSLVSQAGVMGCLVCVIFTAWLPRPMSLVFQLLLQVIGPLCAVEFSLRFCSLYNPPWYHGPYCLQWLLEFLLGTESSTPHSWPRYWGVTYWIICLIVLGAPTWWIVRQHRTVVITRKWFHLVAIVLFAPTTQYFPQLMALGYAVSLCVLLVIEAIRHSSPVLKEFYRLVHDPTKDNTDGIILSHICLILGCAVPLWLSQALSVGSLLPYWGILCLGVGDAMGAVIGKKYGRNKWGRNNRTIEGSLGMWVSMLGSGVLVADQWKPLLASTTLVSLLEAFTAQMDNLVLPLAGSVWIILLSA